MAVTASQCQGRWGQVLRPGLLRESPSSSKRKRAAQFLCFWLPSTETVNILNQNNSLFYESKLQLQFLLRMC